MTTHTIQGISCQVTIEIDGPPAPDPDGLPGFVINPPVAITCRDLLGASWDAQANSYTVQEAIQAMESSLLRRYHQALEMSLFNAPLAHLAAKQVPVLPEALELEQRVNREILDHYQGKVDQAGAHIQAWAEVRDRVAACGQ